MIILTIGAHPADVFDLAGGTVANFAAHGHGVFLAVLTHGAYSHAQVIVSDKQQHAVQDVSAVKRKECDEGDYVFNQQWCKQLNGSLHGRFLPAIFCGGEAILEASSIGCWSDSHDGTGPS